MISLKSILTDLSQDQINQIVETGFEAGRKGRKKKGHSQSSKSNSSNSTNTNTATGTQTRTRTGS